jgi:hypothetical protein
MKKYIYILLLFIIVLNTSCEKFTKGLIVELDIPEHEPILTPYCFINSADSSVTVIVQQSQGVLDNGETRYIENATVELYKNGTLWNTIPYSNDVNLLGINGVYKLSMNRPFSDEGYGDSYELRVSAPDFETTTGTQMMPMPIQIEALDIDLEANVNQFGDISDNVKVTFEDPANEENYYKIQVMVQYHVLDATTADTMFSRVSFGAGPLTTNPSIERGYDGGVIVSDKLFNGQRYTADLSVFRSWGVVGTPIDVTGNLKVTLYSITKDEYLYQKSLVTYDRTSNSLFAEPTLIHENMSGGLGVFSMMSSDILDLDF